MLSTATSGDTAYTFTTIQGRLVHTTAARVCTSTIEWLTIQTRALLRPALSCPACSVMKKTSSLNPLPTSRKETTFQKGDIPKMSEQQLQFTHVTRNQAPRGGAGTRVNSSSRLLLRTTLVRPPLQSERSNL